MFRGLILVRIFLLGFDWWWLKSWAQPVFFPLFKHWSAWI